MINKYKIHVINRDLNFDPTYKNVVQFFNPTDNTKDYTGVFTSGELYFTPIEEEINFNIIDSINASVTLDINGEFASRQFMLGTNEILTLEKALNRQYCIIRKYEYTDEEAFINSTDYFYFMKNPRAINENLVKYDLQLDVFTTYPLFSDIDVSATKITRAHVDRFTNDSTLSTAKYNFDNIFLETGEPIDSEYQKIRKDNVNTKLTNFCGTNYTKLGTSELTKEKIEEILNNTLWLYVAERKNTPNNHLYFAPYYSKKDNYKITYYISKTPNYNVDGVVIRADLLYNTKADENNVYKAYISPFGAFGTINNNINNYRIGYDYNINTNELKIIFICEFEAVPSGYDNYNIYNSYEIDNADNEIKKAMIFNDASTNYLYMDYSDLDMLDNFISYFESKEITLFNDNVENLYDTYNYDIIEKAEIKTKIRPIYNEYKLKSQFDNGETIIDLSILKTPKIKVKVLNNLNPTNDGDVFITLNDIYKKKYGITSKIQYTPQFYGDKFKEYQDTNKNYRITGQAIPIITGTIGGAIAGAKYGGVYGAVGGALVGFGASALKVHTNFDNMENTPDAIKMKGQNITIDSKITPSYVYIEHNELREADKKAVNLYFYEFGYNIGTIQNVKFYFTRNSFNYIQLENCEKDVHALLSTDILNVVIKALNDGVRFWTKTKYIASKFEYTTNNLESKLS